MMIFFLLENDINMSIYFVLNNLILITLSKFSDNPVPDNTGQISTTPARFPPPDCEPELIEEMAPLHASERGVNNSTLR